MAKTVMITDDTAFMRMTLKNVIEKNGYTVVAEAADGEEAVALYKEFRPDMVTMDITMPKMDGITAIKEIMKIDPMPKSLSAAPWGRSLW
jgi:two-component system chemotaxis response regulator CheY